MENTPIYVGVNDHETDLFEGQYVISNGISYNSYVITDEKTAVIDSVDARFADAWLSNLEGALDGRKPDYLVVQHMEPDHSGSIAAFLARYPETQVVASARTFGMIQNFFGLNLSGVTVAEGDTLSLGGRALRFITAPMVHWPEVIMTFDDATGTLFSADAFGRFGALDAEDPDWDAEARRYYIGIVGKYGAQVQAVLKKAAGLDIRRICPLHGPVLTENLSHYIGLYDTWSSYRPEEAGIVIAYTSVYGNTKKAVLELADSLKDQKVVLYDLARCDQAQAVADAFRYDRLVLATTTYNGDIFPFMHTFIQHLTERNFSGRTVAFVENGSWAPTAARIMKGMLEKSKNLTFLEPVVSIRSALNDQTRETLQALSNALKG